jgi:REP element-mobilizing transposase RayT
MPQSFGSLYFHIIFSTKNRVPNISDEIQPRLFEYMGGVLRNQDGMLVAAGGIPDHIHLLASLSRQASISNTVRDLKSYSSRWIHETFPSQRLFAWQTGYGAFSVSYSAIDSVRAYLANQKEHHAKQTFQQEFLAILQLHDLQYDERYIWD